MLGMGPMGGARELGGWDGKLWSDNVSFAAVGPLQVMRLLRYQT